MELSIEQLANLKIAIDKENTKLNELKKEFNTLKPNYDHMESQLVRITEEVEVQAKIKENLIKENNEIREEKQKIQDDYEQKNAIVYQEIRRDREQIDQEKGIVELRLLEVDRREKEIWRKEDEIKNSMNEIKNIKKEVWQERLYLEKLLEQTKQEKDKNTDSISKNLEILWQIQSKEKEIDDKLKDLDLLEKSIIEKTSNNNNLLLEISAKERHIAEIEPKIELVKTYLKEVKDFVVSQKDEEWIEKIAKLEELLFWERKITIQAPKTEEISDENKIDDINEVEEKTEENNANLEEDKVEKDWVEENNKPYEEMTIWEIKEILKIKWIWFNPNNNNKQSLIKLLNQ